jgi:outer membrane scaffolding protein for murein synthesis (MipA/OmpV family)
LIRHCVLAFTLAASAASSIAAEVPVEPGPDIDADLALKERPLWELGIGVSGVRLPDYRGSDESRGYALPLPYIVYRGKWLKSDRDGARAMLYDSQRAKLDLSFSGSTPVDSDDNAARRGMPDLPGVVEFGPNLNFTLDRSLQNRWKLDLRFPVRAAMSIESSPKFVGYTFSPNLNLDISGPSASWNVGVLTGPLFGDRKFHEHYYNVDQEYVTPDRPFYQAKAGYGGWQNTLSASRRIGNMWLGGFARYENLSGAVYEDSPLVKRKSALSFGFGISWILKTSTETVASAQ